MKEIPPTDPDDAAADAWDVLHQGLDREFDSPARYELSTSSVLLPVRVPGVGRHSNPQAPEPLVPAAPATGMPTAASGAPGVPPAQPGPAFAGRGTGGQRMMMRPYARTRGRTRPDYELALEALVSTSDQGRRYEGAASVQHRRICDLCWVATRSIAEIAAYLVLPLNVVKVLVSDMDNLGLVMIHQPGLAFGDRSSREFMARVLHGLRSI